MTRSFALSKCDGRQRSGYHAVRGNGNRRSAARKTGTRARGSGSA